MTSVVMSPLPFLILVICPSHHHPGFLVSLARGSLILWIFFKEPALGFVDYLHWLPVFSFIDFYSNCYFLSSAHVRFNCFSFSCFPRWKIIDFGAFLFTNMCIQCSKFPQALLLLHPTKFDELYFHFHLIQNIFKFLLIFLTHV